MEMPTVLWAYSAEQRRRIVDYASSRNVSTVEGNEKYFSPRMATISTSESRDLE